VKSQAEVDAATRSDMDFLEWVIVILNGVIFAIPILYSFMEDAYSALVDKLSSRKYTDIDHTQDPDVSPGPAEISSQLIYEELHLRSDLVFPGDRTSDEFYQQPFESRSEDPRLEESAAESMPSSQVQNDQSVVNARHCQASTNDGKTFYV